MDKKSPAQETTTKKPVQPIMPPMPADGVKTAPVLEVGDEAAPVTPPEGFVAVPAEQPQKKHTTLIVSILAVIVALLVGVAAAVWYFVCYSNPEKVAYDAVAGFLQREMVATNGIVTGRGKIGDDRFRFDIEIDGQNGTGVSGESRATLKLTPVDANGQGLAEGDYEVEFGIIMLSDGVFYVRADKLTEAAETLAVEMDLNTAEELEVYETILGLLETVDGEWWRISVPELIDEFVTSSDLAQSSKEFYTCLMNVANSKSNRQLADIYSNHRFVNIEKDTTAERNNLGTTYAVSLNYDEMANFSNAVLNTETVTGTENCLQRFVTDGLDGEEVDFTDTETDAESLRQALGEMKISLVISDFGHELKAISVASGDNGAGNADYINADFTFLYPDVTIAPPSKYRPFDDLLELIGAALIELGDIDTDSFYDDEEWNFTIDDTFDDEDFRA